MIEGRRPGEAGGEGKATARAAANLAFVKYWGARDLVRVVPYNHSISMTLERSHTVTTVELLPAEEEHRIELLAPDGTPADLASGFREGIERHLDRIRDIAAVEGRFRVATRNSFPSSAGLASSASGFAALTVAAAKAAGLDLSPKELSALARSSGSGSAARSLFGGYVEWPLGDEESGGWAEPIAPASHWDLRDVIAIVQTGPKPVSSREGHRRATTSPHFAARLSAVGDRLERVRNAIERRDLTELGAVLEEDAVELHLVAMSSKPPIFYWNPGTVEVLLRVRQMREEGLSAYFTMDAGANVHVVCEPASEPEVAKTLSGLEGVSRVIRDAVGEGPVLIPDHLF